MNGLFRPSHPMLAALKRRRGGRIESRRRTGSGVLRLDGRATRLISRNLTLRPLTFAPSWRIAFRVIAPAPGAPAYRAPDRPERITLRREPVMRTIQQPAPALARIRVETRLAQPQPGTRTTLREQIVQRHRRIETRQQTAVSMRERRSVAVEVERAVANAAARIAEQQIGSAAAGAIRQTAPAGLSDLDRLTDQIVNRIDDRLIAHRERMGRTF